MEKRGMMKRFLAESLKELMLQKSFEKITIKQICDKTGVIRATFYNYFEDKYGRLKLYHLSGHRGNCASLYREKAIPSGG